MALIEMLCPSCKKQHTFDSLVPFRAECDACSADLHVCVACRLYDRYVENECREDQSDPVATKDRRNLCEYFKPMAIGGDAEDATALAKKKLAALFGGAPTPAGPQGPSPTSAADAAAEAKRKLDELFKKK